MTTTEHVSNKTSPPASPQARLRETPVTFQDPRPCVQGADHADEARTRWLEASTRASGLASELFQPGSGYGDPEARTQDEHKLQSARLEAERLFREYNDIERRTLESKMVMLQRSQRLATWASFAVAAAVGAATIIKTLIDLLK